MQARDILQSGPKLETLQELSCGAFGRLSLARMTAGPEAGRLVVARRLALSQLEDPHVERILAATRNYSSLSHPSLVKLLGGHRAGADLVLLEEQVIGVPLSKLHELASAHQVSIPICIGTKLVLDALLASAALRKGCRDQGLLVPAQMIFPDSVVVASFGEALLSGIGVMQELCQCRSVRQHPDLVDVLDPATPAGDAAERLEVYTAGALLWKLLLIRSLFDNCSNQQTLSFVLHSDALLAEYGERLNLCVPKPIADIIRRATHDGGLRYSSIQEMIAAVEDLPSALLAGDQQVRDWLNDIAGDYLSDVQHSSGVRKVPLGLRAPRRADAFASRPSYIPTPLPGTYAPVMPKVTPFWSEPGEGKQEPTSVTTGGSARQSEATAMPVGERRGASKRHIRNAYVLGALLGLVASLGILYFSNKTSGQSKFVHTAPSPTAAGVTRNPVVDRTMPVAPMASLQEPGAGSATPAPAPSADVNEQANDSMTQDSTRDAKPGDPSSANRSSKRTGPHAKASHSSYSGNRWGI
jgi:hypothetical protein